MKSLVFNILDKEKFQKQTLFYFKDSKHLVFLNSNTENSNLIAISNSNKILENDWRFGFISYDYKNQLEKLTSNNFDGIEFPDKVFFSPELLFKVTNDEVIVLFDSSIYSQYTVNQIVEKINLLELNNEQQGIVNITPRTSKKEYLEHVKALKEHIQQGDIYEVNYCQEFYAEHADITPSDVYFKLNKVSPTPFSCFVKYNDTYLMSGSPERFIKKEGSKIISQPIKGTLRRGETEEEDLLLKQQLLNDKKELSENVMIVDLVRNDLAKIADKNSVNVDELFEIQTFSQVHQMVSTVSANLGEDVSFERIIEALFPMGSMTGAPKIRAMELIEKYEKTKRGLYSGTVGYVNPEEGFDFNVIIRSILYNKQTKYLSFIVGGAITSLSEPEKEYEECMLKAKAMFQVLKN